MNKRILVAVASAALLMTGSLQAAEGIKDRALDVKDGALDLAHRAKNGALDAAHYTKNAIIDGGETVKDKVMGKPRHASSTASTKRSLRAHESDPRD
jgi:hypothetical protein